MNTVEYIAQAIGIAAIAFNILSYQRKSSRGVIAMQLCGGALFAVNFFLLGATVGGIMNVIGVVRAVVFINRKALRAEHPAWLVGFIALYGLSYIATFTLFGKELTGISAVIELLPVIGMTATTLSFRRQDAKAIRLYGLISSPSWLVYNIANVAVGAILCEALSLISIVVGLLRHDLNRRKKP